MFPPNRKEGRDHVLSISIPCVEWGCALGEVGRTQSLENKEEGHSLRVTL